MQIPEYEHSDHSIPMPAYTYPHYCCLQHRGTLVDTGHKALCLVSRYVDREQLQLLVRRVEVDHSCWSGVLKSTSAMTKMTVESSHRRSCAISSALLVQLVWKWPDVPCCGSGSPALGALPSETARKQPGEPPKIDLQGVDDVDEARARIPPNPPSNPSLLCCGGCAAERHYCRA